MTKPIALSVLALSVSAPALAFGPPQPDPERVHQHVEEALDQVGATEDQKTSFHAILEERVTVLQSFRTEAHALRDEVHGLFGAETIDRVALEDARVDMVDLFDRFSAVAFDTVADLMEVLTPEQRIELQEIREERRQRFWHHAGPSRG